VSAGKVYIYDTVTGAHQPFQGVDYSVNSVCRCGKHYFIVEFHPITFRQQRSQCAHTPADVDAATISPSDCVYFIQVWEDLF